MSEKFKVVLTLEQLDEMMESINSLDETMEDMRETKADGITPDVKCLDRYVDAAIVDAEKLIECVRQYVFETCVDSEGEWKKGGVP